MIYRTGYDYQLMEMAVIRTNITGHDIRLAKIYLRVDGLLFIDKWFAWDGPSGPPKWLIRLPLIGKLYRPLHKTLLRASLMHDAIYELFRHDLLPQELRKLSDSEFRRIAIEDGTNSVRAWWAYRAVRKFGSDAVKQRAKLRTL